MARYLEKRQLLILAGLLCQGFTFEDWPWTMAGLYGLGWLLAVSFRRQQRFLPERVEELLLLAGIVLAYRYGGVLGYNRLVFIGNALALYQLLHLTWELSLREKMFSLAVALMHLAVGSQVVISPLKFIPLLIVVLTLLPGAFFELEAERFRKVSVAHRLGPSRREYAYLFLLMVAFFLLFPRSRLVGQLPNPVANPMAVRQEMEMTMTAPGQAENEALLMRIEGKDLRYVKRLCYDLFDGRVWRSSPFMLQQARSLPRDPPAGTLYRRVQVVSSEAVRHILPADGNVAAIRGGFLDRPFVTKSGTVLLSFLPRRISDYEYWTSLAPATEELHERDRSRLLGQSADVTVRRAGEERQGGPERAPRPPPAAELRAGNAQPPPSAALRQWRDGVLAGESDPYRQAQRLCTWFQTNCSYNLGAPDLDRLSPLDDFILIQREGHCERFASALAYLLRTLGIPSRVAVGYVANEYNELANITNIRSKHAHAWSEAYFPDRGWVILDATPYGRSTDFAREPRSLRTTLAEWFEYTWYAKVVEFSSTDQDSLLATAGSAVSWLVEFVTDYALELAVLLCTAGLLLLATRTRWRALLHWDRPRPDRPDEQRLARHFYGQMLRELARQHCYRRPQQTPLEFLAQLEAFGHPRLAEIRALTDAFCRVRYGNQELAPRADAELTAALARLSRARAEVRRLRPGT